MDHESLLLLGAPIFKGRALQSVLQNHSDILDQAIEDMVGLQAQSAMILLRSCFGAAKLTFVLRTAPCWDDPLLQKMDNQLRSGVEKILNVELDDVQWKQATLPIRDGGLGIRQVSMLASSAYLASAASTKSLGSTILGMEDWNDEYKNQILSARGSTLPVGNAQALTKQSAWDRPLIEHDKAEVWSAYTDPCSRARLVAVSSPHSGDWLLTMPISSCGLCLDNEAFRVAIGLRLGLKLCAPHQCRCGEGVDPGGHHGLVCKLSSGRASRHYAINDIIWRALQKADIPSSKEPLGLLRSDGKRPDGSTLVPWSAGKYITWDVTNVHTCAPSYIHRTSVMAGGAAELAAVRKQAKYSDLPSSHTFVPIAIESLGPINQSGFDFISEVGRRISAISGDPRERNQLFQRLSICTQQFNAVAFRGAFEDFSGDEAFLLLLLLLVFYYY